MTNLSASTLMMDTSVQCIISLLFLCVFVHASTDIINETYNITLPDGTIRSCNKCWPGHFWKGDCTQENTNSTCVKCQNGTYESGYGQARSCQPCGHCKGERKIVYRPCTLTRNTECGCENGHYIKIEGNHEMLCPAHSKCPRGQGVIAQGNRLNNTVCEKCKPGFFSPNESYTEKCQPCSKCPAGNEPVETCPPETDTICQPNQKENIRLSDGAIAGIVIGIFVFLVLVICVAAVLLARRDKGPQFVQKFYKKCISSRRSGLANNGRLPSGYKYTSTGEPEDQDLIDNKLTQISPDLSKDLIHPEWKFFFRYLFGENSDQYINEAELNNHGNVREQIHRLLKDWVMREREKATEERVIDALRQHGRMDLVQKHFGKKSSSSVTNV